MNARDRQGVVVLKFVLEVLSVGTFLLLLFQPIPIFRFSDLAVCLLPFLFAAVDLGFGDGDHGAEQLVQGFEGLAVRLARGG